VEYQDGALVEWKAPELPFHAVSLAERDLLVGDTLFAAFTKLRDLDLDSSLLAMSCGVARSHREPVKPGVPRAWVAKGA
jgi:hypothetical protein